AFPFVATCRECGPHLARASELEVVWRFEELLDLAQRLLAAGAVELTYRIRAIGQHLAWPGVLEVELHQRGAVADADRDEEQRQGQAGSERQVPHGEAGFGSRGGHEKRLLGWDYQADAWRASLRAASTWARASAREVWRVAPEAL